MQDLILISVSHHELKSLIEQSVSKALESSQPKKHNLPLSDEDFITIQQASEFTHIAIPTLYDYTHKKKIPFHKVGKRLIFSKKELTEWITSKNK